MIDIEIDGKKIQVPEGTMIIEAADKHGIHIPRFCYHKKLSIAANCRMCLVEVERAPKALPACATPVTSGMKIFTQTDTAIEAQKAVMEFLLINHPLDCPICDQGGQCELQDIAMGYGKGVSRYNEGKRAVEDENLGSLIATDMTRCIHCTRCVRFGEEIAGIREMGVTGRGEESKIGTYIEKSLTSEMSGNIIDVCPVGALTSKPFRFQARAWELTQHQSIAPHDCIGSNINLHIRRNEVLRVVPRENEDLNEVWLSDRDRFSYEGLMSDDRVAKPMIKREGKWGECDWSEALNFVAEKLNKVKAHHSPNQVGAIISPNATLEEHYLLQKVMREYGCHNIDHRIRRVDFRNNDNLPLCPTSSFTLAELEDSEAVLLVGSDIQREQPIACLRLRKAVINNDALVMSVNPINYDFNFDQHEAIIVAPNQIVFELAAILKALISDQTSNQNVADILKLISNIEPSKKHLNIAEILKSKSNTSLVIGAIAQHHPEACVIQALAEHIAALTSSRCGMLTNGANGAGAWLAGAVPHRQAAGQSVTTPGLNCREMFSNQLKAYVLFNLEPELDCASPQTITSALTQADFVVSISPFNGGVLNAHADVILPIAPFSETSGTFVNAMGNWQHFTGGVSSFGESRPGWKVLRVLGNLLDVSGCDYISSEEVRDELRDLLDKANLQTSPYQITSFPTVDKSKFQRITEWPMYRADNLVRRSKPLQESKASECAEIRINETMIKTLNLEDDKKAIAVQNNVAIELPLIVDNRIPDNCVYVPAGFSQTAKLGDSFGSIEIKKIGD